MRSALARLGMVGLLGLSALAGPRRSGDNARGRDEELPGHGRGIFILYILIATLLTLVGLRWYAVDWAGFAVAMFAALAAFASGAAGGFLFGIPRSDPARTDGEGAADGRHGLGYRPNTNLEQISDWLTKILVGVGLTQFRSIGEALGTAADALGRSIGRPGGDGHVLALALLVWYSVSGFLITYLWTRLYLPELFQRAENKAERVLVHRMRRQAEVAGRSAAQTSEP